MKERCSERVYGDRIGSWQCQNSAVVQREGKSYCRIHDPEYIKEKDQKRREKYDKEYAEDQARYHRRDVLRQIGEGFETSLLERNLDKIRDFLLALPTK